MSEHAPGYAPDEAESLSGPTVDVRALRAVSQEALRTRALVTSDVLDAGNTALRDELRAFNAWCDVASPQAVLALLNRLEALEAALAFYADDQTYLLQPPSEEENTVTWSAPIHTIKGSVARAALGREEASRE